MLLDEMHNRERLSTKDDGIYKEKKEVGVRKMKKCTVAATATKEEAATRERRLISARLSAITSSHTRKRESRVRRLVNFVDCILKDESFRMKSIFGICV